MTCSAKCHQYPSVFEPRGLKRDSRCAAVYAKIVAELKGDRSDAVTDDNVLDGRDVEGWPRGSAGGIALRLPQLSVYGKRGDRLQRRPRM